MLKTVRVRARKIGRQVVATLLTEPALCMAFVAAKIFLFVVLFGAEIGFDSNHHLEIVEKISLRHWNLPLKEFFYSYHPPAAFLIAKNIMPLGFTELGAVQVVSFASSLIAFFCLREALRQSKLLADLRAVIFLYLASAMPLQLYLQASVNLDVIILAIASAVLLLSVRLFWGKPKRFFRLQAIALALLLALGMMVKFSGALLFALPVLAALTGPRNRLKKHLAGACIAGACAAALVGPYYVDRYVSQTGSLFPINLEWMIGDTIDRAREKFAADPLGFAAIALSPAPLFDMETIDERDPAEPRLMEVWMDFWLKQGYGEASRSAFLKFMATVELYLASVFIVVGLWRFLIRREGTAIWRRLGWFMIGFGLIQAAALVSHLLRFPTEMWGMLKAIYIAPAVWAIGFVLAASSPAELLASPRGRRWAMAALTAFTLVNVMGPVYV